MIKEAINNIFPNNETYIVGSSCIKNVKANDIDILVLYDKAITKKEWQRIHKETRQALKGVNFGLIINFKEDNLYLKEEFPYIDLKTDDEKLIDRNEMTQEEYDVLKNKLHLTRYKASRFIEKGIIR
jgi:thiamine monophosphate synthase